MSDDKSNRGPADRSRINIHESYEVLYWCKELGVSPEKLKELVQQLGASVVTIRQALRK
jgi:hypothetical protein